MRLSIEVSQQEGGHLVRLGGDLDLQDAGSLRGLLGALGTDVVVDLESLSFVDARGISAFVAAKREVEQAGHRLVLCNAVGRVRHVFELLDLVSYFGL